VLWELAHAGGPLEVTQLRERFGMDPGHLSRLLTRLERQGLLRREPSPSGDRRKQRVALTDEGREAFATLDRRSADAVGAQLAELSEPARERLTRALGEVRRALDPAPRARTVVLRGLRHGDLGWVVMRNAQLYAAEYDWDASYEALVARIVADFASAHDPAREAAWIAEVDGRPAGCVFCVRQDDATAKLRLLLVEPSARGTGIGGALVDECVRFARAAGYRELTLWTNDPLSAARRVYERAGFTLAHEDEPGPAFGHVMRAQTWTKPLR
jgi:DNA-binding MarR family transcriptional regulator/GNAT superfamily N-acetyltransferase